MHLVSDMDRIYDQRNVLFQQRNDGFFEKNQHQETADQLGVPLIRPRAYRSNDPNPVVAICGECGRKVHRLEGYYCSVTNCPVQNHATSSTKSRNFQVDL
jgi:hypothetical protein